MSKHAGSDKIPPTHKQGQRLNAAILVGMGTFKDGINSNHRLIHVNLNVRSLLGAFEKYLELMSSQKLQSTRPKRVKNTRSKYGKFFSLIEFRKAHKHFIFFRKILQTTFTSISMPLTTTSLGWWSQPRENLVTSRLNMYGPRSFRRPICSLGSGSSRFHNIVWEEILVHSVPKVTWDLPRIVPLSHGFGRTRDSRVGPTTSQAQWAWDEVQPSLWWSRLRCN